MYLPINLELQQTDQKGCDALVLCEAVFAHTFHDFDDLKRLQPPLPPLPPLVMQRLVQLENRRAARIATEPLEIVIRARKQPAQRQQKHQHGWQIQTIVQMEF